MKRNILALVAMPGDPAPEMPFNPAAAHRERIQENMEDWHSAGSGTVTAPAETFDCEHWRNGKAKSDAWITDKVTLRPWLLLLLLGHGRGIEFLDETGDAVRRIRQDFYEHHGVILADLFDHAERRQTRRAEESWAGNPQPPA